MEHAQGGLGIGLTFVRRLVELHGGTVAASSGGPGKGSKFVVRLPTLNLPEEASGDSVPDIQSSGMDSKRRILVVDDNQDSAHSLAMMLRQVLTIILSSQLRLQLCKGCSLAKVKGRR